MDFLQLENRSVLVLGVANRKSVAWKTAEVLREAGAKVLLSVRSEARREQVEKFAKDMLIFVCDVEQQSEIDQLRADVVREHPQLAGIVHSIAEPTTPPVGSPSTKPRATPF